MKTSAVQTQNVVV